MKRTCKAAIGVGISGRQGLPKTLIPRCTVLFRTPLATLKPLDNTISWAMCDQGLGGPCSLPITHQGQLERLRSAWGRVRGHTCTRCMPPVMGREMKSKARRPLRMGDPPTRKLSSAKRHSAATAAAATAATVAALGSGIREAAGSLLRLAIGLDTPLVLQPYPFLLFEMAEYALPVPTSLCVTLRQRNLFRSVSERGTEPLVPVAYTTSQ